MEVNGDSPRVYGNGLRPPSVITVVMVVGGSYGRCIREIDEKGVNCRGERAADDRQDVNPAGGPVTCCNRAG
jgi:hypothetical protein